MKNLTRRAVLAGVLAAMVEADPVSGGIVDTHVHFYDPARPGGVPWPPKTDTVLYKTTLPADYTALVRPLGVTSAVAIEASPLVSDNQWLLNMAKSNPVVAAVIGNLDPADESFRRNLEIFAKDRKYRGVRLNSDRLRNCLWKTEAIDRLRALEQRGLTVDMLGDGSTFLEDVLRFNDRLPQVKLVVDHLPFKDEKHVIKEFSGRGSVFAKLSGVPRRVNGQVPPGIDSYRETLDQLWQVFGEDRLVYASNWPVSNLVAPYREVLMVHQEYLETKNPAARQKYFRENSKLAYGWDDNG